MFKYWAWLKQPVKVAKYRIMVAYCIILIAAILLAGCSPDRYGSRVYDLDGIFNDDPSGKDIKIGSFVEPGQVQCTDYLCPASDPCCNNCYAKLFLVDPAKTDLRIETDKRCTGNNCRLDCEIPTNQSHILNGRLELTNLRYYIFRVAYP
ncbi:hypothetical protein HYY72_01630 [Candidatus Woesearchaeota archaeon]|nr:hypothetical protein [Candidatus Woesearchaeota archaeon]